MEQRNFTVEYTRISTDEPVDVSFELSEDAEDVLFSGIAGRLDKRARNGTFDGQLIHLYKRLAEQQESHPPWIDTDDSNRTYDIELTEADYSELSRVIGNQITHVIAPEAADKYRELVEVWNEITDQMQNPSGAPSDPERGEFQHMRSSSIAVYKDPDTGETWASCTVCGRSYANVPDEHDCEYNE